MKKSIYLIFIIIVLLLTIPLYGFAGGRVFVGGHGGGHGGGRHSGHGFYWGGTIALGPWYPWGPWYPYGAWYPYPYYSAGPPVIIQQRPPVYLQKDQPESNYWYYCQNPQGYYPYIKSCPGGWMKVVPETPEQ